jgi:hypothetical protein
MRLMVVNIVFIALSFINGVKILKGKNDHAEHS